MSEFKERLPLKLPQHDRYEFSPIDSREDFTWPDGKRLAVFFGVNLENFAFGVKGGACIQGGHPLPDVLNYSWRDYGMRVGVWRMIDLFDELGLSECMVNVINTSCYEDCPEVVKAFRDRKCDVLAHGHTNSEAQGLFSEDDERALIKDVRDLIAKNEGAAPTGWLGPGISQSRTTIDLLEEEGFEYQCDWGHDDQPNMFKTRSGKGLLSVPYSLEINDITQIIARQHSAEEFAVMMCSQFDEMLEQAIKKKQSLVYSANFHPFIIGQPFRMRALRLALQHIKKKIDEHKDVVWLAGPSKIAKHYKSLNRKE